jgi:AcrR family transcriptional regulator
VNRERRILEAAEEQFYKRSFDGVGVAAIGEHSGVPPSTIYRFFESKDEILATLFDEAIDALQQLTSEVNPDPMVERDQLIRAHADFALNRYRLAAIWSREQQALAEPYRRRVHRRQRQYIDRWIDCLDACYPGWSRDDLAAAVRATHALLTSDGTRPSTAAQAPHLHDVLVGIAIHGLESLKHPQS